MRSCDALFFLTDSVLVELSFFGSRFGDGDGQPIDIARNVEGHGSGTVEVARMSVKLRGAERVSDARSG